MIGIVPLYSKPNLNGKNPQLQDIPCSVHVVENKLCQCNLHKDNPTYNAVIVLGKTEFPSFFITFFNILHYVRCLKNLSKRLIN